MRRAIGVAALIGGLMLVPAFAHAQDAQPSPERIKAAAEEFDRGRRADLAKDFEQAAQLFENAYRDAPSKETLRLAIRARRDAKQLARAATLAAMVQARYPDDAASMQYAKETLDSADSLWLRPRRTPRWRTELKALSAGNSSPVAVIGRVSS